MRRRESLRLPAAVLTLALATLGCTADETPPPGDPAAVLALVSGADRLEVTEDGSSGSPTIYESSDPRDISALHDALDFVTPEELVLCACIGSPAIHLFLGDTKLGVVTNHHGLRVRSSEVAGDLELRDPQRWLAWFDARGLTGPREEFEDMQESRLRNAAHERAWLAAMPEALRPHWAGCVDALGIPGDMSAMSTALRRAHPDPRDRVRELLRWYGSGTGRWSGYPGYESVAELLLLEFPSEVIVGVAAESDATPAQLVGAARLLQGLRWDESRVAVLAQLDPVLRGRLLHAGLEGADPDRRERALAAFGEP